MHDVTLRISQRALRRLALALFAGGCAAAGFGVAHATLPSDDDALAFSGVLEEDGAPVNGTRSIRVSIFDAPADGGELCNAEDVAAPVVAGRFQVPLPASCVDAARGPSPLFVEVRVGGVPLGARARVGAVPFAVQAQEALIAEDVRTLPSGAVIAFDLAACPAGWSELATARGRGIVGAGAGAGLTPRALDETFGEESHTLTIAELPAHDHGGATLGVDPAFQADAAMSNTGSGSGVTTFGYILGTGTSNFFREHTHGIAAEGGGAAHPILPPSLALLFCRKD